MIPQDFGKCTYYDIFDREKNILVIAVWSGSHRDVRYKGLFSDVAVSGHRSSKTSHTIDKFTLIPPESGGSWRQCSDVVSTLS